MYGNDYRWKANWQVSTCKKQMRSRSVSRSSSPSNRYALDISARFKNLFLDNIETWREKPQSFFSLQANQPETFCATRLETECNTNTELMWHSISYLRGVLLYSLLIDLIRYAILCCTSSKQPIPFIGVNHSVVMCNGQTHT